MFTVAETFSIALSLPSTLAAQAAHVIPRTKSSKRTSLDDSPGPGDRPLLNAADDMQRHIQAIPLVGKTSTECLPQLRGGHGAACRYLGKGTGQLVPHRRIYTRLNSSAR